MAAITLDEHSHIGREAEDVFLHAQVAGVYDIGPAYALSVFIYKPREGLRRVVLTGFYLYGKELKI